MKTIPTTSIPNYIFDSLLPHLTIAELKVLLVIARNTLGWKDNQSSSGRKTRDWISSGQLQRKTGCSRRSISSAIGRLVNMGVIAVSSANLKSLDNPHDRKGKQRLFFQLRKIHPFVVENLGNTTGFPLNNFYTCANNAQHLSKKIAELGQHLRITKETLTK